VKHFLNTEPQISDTPCLGNLYDHSKLLAHLQPYHEPPGFVIPPPSEMPLPRTSGVDATFGYPFPPAPEQLPTTHTEAKEEKLSRSRQGRRAADMRPPELLHLGDPIGERIARTR
jgi:hypothetical protein